MEHTTISSASASAAPPWPASRSPRRNTLPAPEASGGHHGIGDGSSSSRRREPAPTGTPAAGARQGCSTPPRSRKECTEPKSLAASLLGGGGGRCGAAHFFGSTRRCLYSLRGAGGQRPEQITNQIEDPHMPGTGGNKRNQQGKGSRALTCRRAARAETRAPASGDEWREAEGMGREGEDASEGGRGV
jgi:hypothetical protein